MLNVPSRALAWCPVVLVLSLAVSGCASMHAKTPPVTTMLMPPPPVRVTIPVTLPEPEPLPPPEPPPVEPPAAPPRTREPATSRPPASTPTPPEHEAAPTPAPVLQTTTDSNALAQKTQTLLGQAQRDLDHVQYPSLSPQARAQYESAQGFIRSAKNAIAIKNYMLAESLAEKAAAVASELVKG
jgi:outer membrane biosynthesis protein TonB